MTAYRYFRDKPNSAAIMRATTLPHTCIGQSAISRNRHAHSPVAPLEHSGPQLGVEQSNSWNRKTSLAVLEKKKKKKKGALRMKPASFEEPAGSHVSHMPSYVCSVGVLQLLLFYSSLFKENVTRPQGLTNICWHFFWVSLRRPARI